MKCPKCDKTLKDGAKFCSGCGEKINQPTASIPETTSIEIPEGTPASAVNTATDVKVCPTCGTVAPVNSAFCKQCGTNMVIAGSNSNNTVNVQSANVQPVNIQPANVRTVNVQSANAHPANAQTVNIPPANVHPVNAQTMPGKRFGGKKLIITLILGVAVLGALAGGFFMFNKGRGGSESNYALYTEDNELLFSNLVKDKEQQLTSKLYAEDNAYYATNGQMYMGTGTLMAKDGKTLFYPEKIDSDEMTIYYRNIKKPNEDGTKVASGIKGTTYSANAAAYTVNDAVTIVTYLSYEGDNLYQYTMKDGNREKIASGVMRFQVSDDGETIFYLDDENRLYMKKNGADKEKIDGDVYGVHYVSDDFKTIWYVKNDALYKKLEGHEAIKISSDIYDVLAVYDSGEAYYTKGSLIETSLMNFVQDDMKDTDTGITAPDSPDAPELNEYKNRQDYEKAYAEYEKAFEEYEEAYDIYSEKVNRDRLRSELEEGEIAQYVSSLCYFDGKEEIVVNENYASDYYNIWSMSNPIVIYEAYDFESVSKVELSTIYSIYEVEEQAYAALAEATKRHIAVAANDSVLEQEEASYITITLDGKAIYYLDDFSSDGASSELYKIAIEGGVPQKAEVYDSDVYPLLTLTQDDQLIYYKDVEDGVGELYIDKVKIDDDVLTTAAADLDCKRVAYFTDWSYDNLYGTLNVYENGKAKKIADDVNCYSFAGDNQIVYMYDYSYDYESGEIYLYKNDKTEKLASDASALIEYFHGEQRNEYFEYWLGWGTLFKTTPVSNYYF